VAWPLLPFSFSFRCVQQPEKLLIRKCEPSPVAAELRGQGSVDPNVRCGVKAISLTPPPIIRDRS